MEDVLARYVHFIGIIFLSSTLVAEHILLSTQISNSDLKRLLRLDLIYGISAVVVLAAGMTLWLWVGKPAAFYSHNPIFHLKLAVFILMALFSIHPTLFLLRHRNTTLQTIAVPKSVINVVRVEAGLLLLMPLLAVLMAHGYGVHN